MVRPPVGAYMASLKVLPHQPLEPLPKSKTARGAAEETTPDRNTAGAVIATQPSQALFLPGDDPTQFRREVRPGADVFVAGSAVFGADDPDAMVRQLRESAEAARPA